IDIQPYANTQAVERADIVNVGGFSDQVFKLIANVSKGQASENHWVNEIERMRL
ncbi:MAG TPA: RNA-binding protein, partial [Planctomycetaceae bacterium]|nr:RNA-binding protein [Planctomycetaceae bacterium]